MIKILCLFQRDFSGGKPRLLRAVTQGCDWVLAGEGTATRKRDGTSCLVKGGVLYKRYDVKKGKTVPAGAIACTPQADGVTGHWPHWIEVGSEPDSVWHMNAWTNLKPRVLEDGTYELCGPKINGNPEGLSEHVFIRHGSEVLGKVPRDFDGLREFLRLASYEGIVFHHGDGRMVKIRRDDYGFSWPPKSSSPPPSGPEDDATDEERRDWAAEDKHDFIKEGR
ncbi:MAG TPA: DUF5565 family protein [Thermoanaerobaculia bacterium]|nr:DUF5565 family protein [Thermoanaerobaculia bacterium]